MSELTTITHELAELLEQKRIHYGDSIASSEPILRALFPNGVPPERYGRVLLIARICDKLQRYATGAACDTEEPLLDLAGYAICGIADERERKQRECASVSEPGAAGESTEPNSSAARSAGEPTTTNESEPSAQPSAPLSTPPSSSTSSATDTPAPTAGGGQDDLPETRVLSQLELLLLNQLDENSPRGATYQLLHIWSRSLSGRDCSLDEVKLACQSLDDAGYIRSIVIGGHRNFYVKPDGRNALKECL